MPKMGPSSVGLEGEPSGTHGKVYNKGPERWENVENTFSTTARRRQEEKCIGSLTVKHSRNSDSQEVAQDTSCHLVATCFIQLGSLSGGGTCISCFVHSCSSV